GAVIGSALATFWWLEAFGTRRTIWFAAAINALIAIAARRVRAEPGQPEEAGPARTARPTPPVPFVLIASGAAGLPLFLMGLVWYRMLGPLLGGSVFTFGLILSVALSGVGVGGLLYALAGERRPATLAAFAFTCLLEAAALAIGYALGDRLAILTFVLLPLGRIGFTAQVGAWTLITAIVVLPPALVAGYQFPLLIALLGSGRDHVGGHVGRAYAANTIGAIAGSLAGGFGLLPRLTAPGAWRAAGFSLGFLGLAAIALAARRGERRRLASPIALAAVTAALFSTTGPTAVWRHSGIAAARARLNLASYNDLVDWMHAERRIITWEGEGVESSVALQAT